jgi:putative nucleotidyltransferase with HDIG domain
VNRSEALAIVRKYSDKETTYRHLVSVEGVMRALARRFDEDVDRWGLAGLFHDLDQDLTHDNIDRHGHQSVEWLRAEGFDDDAVLNAVLAHMAVGMKVSSVKKKLKEKSFAPGVERDKIRGVEESIGIPLDDFLATSISGLQEVAPDIGLA